MVLLEVVRMNLKVLFTQLEVIKKSLLVLRQDKLELYQLRLKKKYWELDSGQLLKTNCFSLETLKQLIIQVPTWTSTGSPQPSAQISAPTFQQMQDLSTFMQDKLGYTTGPWENYDGVSKSFLLKLIGTSITLINFLFVMFITILLLTN
jgi:hypothetical protein